MATQQISKQAKRVTRNINVQSHNKERRPEVAGPKGTFNSLNMGYEGFSAVYQLPKMDPIFGHRREFAYLFMIIVSMPLIYNSRKTNSKNLAAQIKCENRFAAI